MSLQIEENISLAERTTLGVGGKASYFAVVKEVSELSEAVDFADVKDLPIIVLGSGSNILVADGIVNCLVLKNELKGVSFLEEKDKTARVIASAGENWDEFVESVVNRGLSGLENLSGVPGTVGAAPVQNINCYGVSVSDVIEEVEVFDLVNKQISKLSSNECKFGYRDSIFKQTDGEKLIVTAVTFRLLPSVTANVSYRSSSQSIEKYLTEKNISDPKASDIRQAILYVRKNIGMLEGQYRSAGSFFKNTSVSTEEFARIDKVVKEKFTDLDKKFTPWHWSQPGNKVKISTAFLLECGPYNKSTFGTKRWKEVVGISPVHTLSIVTEEGATAKDVNDFVSLIADSVSDTFGIRIESEVNYIGDW